MQRAKLFMNGRSQAVRLPDEFRFEGSEVHVRRDPLSGDVILSAKRAWNSWDEFMAGQDPSAVPDDFLADRALPAEQIRNDLMPAAEHAGSAGNPCLLQGARRTWRPEQAGCHSGGWSGCPTVAQRRALISQATTTSTNRNGPNGAVPAFRSRTVPQIRTKQVTRLVVLLRTGSDLRSVHHGVPEPPVLPEAPGVPASADSAPPRPVRKLTRQVSSSVPVPKPLSLFF